MSANFTTMLPGERCLHLGGTSGNFTCSGRKPMPMMRPRIPLRIASEAFAPEAMAVLLENDRQSNLGCETYFTLRVSHGPVWFFNSLPFRLCQPLRRNTATNSGASQPFFGALLVHSSLQMNDCVLSYGQYPAIWQVRISDFHRYMRTAWIAGILGREQDPPTTRNTCCEAPSRVQTTSFSFMPCLGARALSERNSFSISQVFPRSCSARYQLPRRRSGARPGL